MVNVFISLGLQNMKSCLRGNLEVLDLKRGQQLEFVEELELADVVLTEPNSIHLFQSNVVIALSDNENLLSEHDYLLDIVPFPTSHNDLPPVISALVAAKIV